MIRICVLILCFAAMLAACEPISGDLTPTSPNATQSATATHTARPTSTTIPIASETPIASFPTPTIEFCEAVTIEYEVIVPSVNVRSGRGTNFTLIGTLNDGDTFLGSLCVDPDATNTYYWTRILEEGHALQGGWVAYLQVNGSGRFLQ